MSQQSGSLKDLEGSRTSYSQRHQESSETFKVFLKKTNRSVRFNYFPRSKNYILDITESTLFEATSLIGFWFILIHLSALIFFTMSQMSRNKDFSWSGQIVFFHHWTDQVPLTCLLLPLAGELPLQGPLPVQLHALMLLFSQGGGSWGGSRWGSWSRGRVDRLLQVIREAWSIKRIRLPKDMRFRSCLFFT